MTSHCIFRAMTFAGLMAASHLVQAFTPAPDKPAEKVTLIEIGNLYAQGSSSPQQEGYVFRSDDPAPEDMPMVWRSFSVKEATSDSATPPRAEIAFRALGNTGNNLSILDVVMLPSATQARLEVGKYQSHASSGSLEDPAGPSFDVSGFGNYFADLGRNDADFEIVELTRDAAGEVTSFAANFVLTNVHFPRVPTPYAVTGRFWYNSDALNVISVPEPQSTALMIAGLAVAAWIRTGRARRGPSH